MIVRALWKTGQRVHSSFLASPFFQLLSHSKKKKKTIKLLTYFRNLFFAYWKDFDMLDKLPFGGEMATLWFVENLLSIGCTNQNSNTLQTVSRIVSLASRNKDRGEREKLSYSDNWIIT